MAGPSTFVDAGMDVHGPGLVSTLIIYLQLLQYLIFIAEFNAEVKKRCQVNEWRSDVNDMLL
jgi:hypothetical protein